MSKHITLDEFNDIKVKIDYEKVVRKYAKRTADRLKVHPAVSPSSGRPNRTTPYWAGWDISERVRKGSLRDTVWNRTNWQLTHLLENGHFITNQGALAWSPPKKHIKPTFELIKPQYIRAMKKVPIDAQFK